MKDLKNKTALVTGGSKGIGLSIAKSLLDQGVNVCITGRNVADLDKAAVELNAPNLLTFACDARNYDDQVSCVEKTIARFGALDILVANAGVGVFKDIADLSITEWQEVIDVNLTGVFYSVKAALPSLTASKGYIITISSLAGTNFFENGTAYNASKFGLVGFSQALMLDVRKKDIKVTTIMPGSVATYFNGHVPDDGDAWKIQPEDIGQMVVDLLNMPERTLPSKIEVRPSFPHKR